MLLHVVTGSSSRARAGIKVPFPIMLFILPVLSVLRDLKMGLGPRP